MDIQDTTAKTGLFGGLKAALFGEKGLFYPGSLKAFKEGWQEAEAESHLVSAEEIKNYQCANPFDPNEGIPDPLETWHPLHELYWGES